MLKHICTLVTGLLILTACGAEAPTVPPTATPAQPTEPANQSSANGERDLTLRQTIESETGVTYQLPADWVVDDNASVSNFASDADAVLDSLNLGAPESRRWMVLGSVSVARPDQIMGLAEASSFEEAAARLHDYYSTADFSLLTPGTWEPGNGRTASVAVGLNPDRPGWATAVYYVDTDTDAYIVVFFESPADVIMQVASMRDEVAAGAVLR